jgi:hypothetical protein
MRSTSAWFFGGLAWAAAALPAAGQIAGERAFQSPVPFFRDLGPWDPAYQPPRTSDGRPDLEGVWSSASLTTMTRNRFPGQNFEALVIPQETIDEITRAAFYNQRLENDQKPTDPNAPGGDGAGGGDVKGYNNFWIDPGSEYAKVNGEYRSSWIVSPADGQLPLSAAGRQARASRMAAFRDSANTGPEVRTLGDRCLISFGSQAGPPLTNAMYNNHYQIVQTPEQVLIHTEMNHDARVVALGGDRRPERMRPWFGDSVGRWEGDVLVVETTGVHPVQERFGAFPLSPQGKVTERFRRVSDVEILYAFTVEDPVYYTQAWSGEMPLRKSTEAIYEYACHEGNYALAGILRGMAMGVDTAVASDGE